MRTIVLDNEAVQALADPGHRKHRTVVAHLAGVVVRRRRGITARALVPTAVRVEAGWDRSDPRAAAVNRFRLVDAALDADLANVAAGIAQDVGGTVADAHIGAVVRTIADDVVVLTSDPGDIARVTQPQRVSIVRI